MLCAGFFPVAAWAARGSFGLLWVLFSSRALDPHRSVCAILCCDSTGDVACIPRLKSGFGSQPFGATACHLLRSLAFLPDGGHPADLADLFRLGVQEALLNAFSLFSKPMRSNSTNSTRALERPSRQGRRSMSRKGPDERRASSESKTWTGARGCN